MNNNEKTLLKMSGIPFIVGALFCLSGIYILDRLGLYLIGIATPIWIMFINIKGK